MDSPEDPSLKTKCITITTENMDTKRIAKQVYEKKPPELLELLKSTSSCTFDSPHIFTYNDPTLSIRVPEQIIPVKYFKALLLPLDNKKIEFLKKTPSLIIYPLNASTVNYFKITFRDQQKQLPDLIWNVPISFSFANENSNYNDIMNKCLGTQTWESAIQDLAKQIDVHPSKLVLRHHFECPESDDEIIFKFELLKSGRILPPYEPINLVLSQIFLPNQLSYNHSFSFSVIADNLRSIDPKQTFSKADSSRYSFMKYLSPQLTTRLFALQDNIYSQYLRGDFITFLPNLISRLCSEFSTCSNDNSLISGIKGALSSTFVSIFIPFISSVTKKWDFNNKTWESFVDWVNINKSLLTFPIELDTIKAPTIAASKPNANARDTISKLIGLAIASRADFIDLVVYICQKFVSIFSGNHSSQPLLPCAGILGTVLCSGQVSIESEKLVLILTRGFVYLCTAYDNSTKSFQIMPSKLPPKCSIVLALPLSQWNFLPLFQSGFGTFSGPKLIKIQFDTDNPQHDITAFWILMTLAKLNIDNPAVDVPIPSGAVINLSYPYESDNFSISATVSILSHTWVSHATMNQVVDVIESYRSIYLSKKADTKEGGKPTNNQDSLIVPSVRSMTIPNLYTGETQLNICSQLVEADKLKAAINFTTPMTFLSSEDNKRQIIDQILLRHMVHCAIHDILYSYNIDLIFNLLLLFKLSDLTYALNLCSESLLTIQIESFRMQLEKYRISNVPLLHFASLSSNEPQFIHIIAKTLYNGKLCIDDEGQNPLFYSLKNPNIAITQVLLDAKVDVNQCNKYGISPLISCLIAQDYSRAEFLLKNGAHVNQCMLSTVRYESALSYSIRYESALFYAIRENKNMKDALPLLLAYADNEINNPSFNGSFVTHNCIQNKFTKIFKDIHIHCPSFNPNLNTNPFPHPLHYLLIKFPNNEDTAVEVLNDLLCIPTLDLNYLKENKEAKEVKEGDTPLMKAISNGFYKFAETLINDERCDVNLLNSSGETPLLLAISKGAVSTVKALIKANALVDMPNTKGMTPLYAAVEKNNKQLVQILLEAGALPNQWYFNGNLPIHIAKPEISELLVKYGANKSLPNFSKSEVSLS